MTTTLEHADVSDQKSHVSPAAESTGLLQVIDTLTDKQQEVLRLKFQGGLSYAEIANVMDITVNHVGVMIHNAIKTLRERMAGGTESPVLDQKATGRRLAAEGEVLS